MLDEKQLGALLLDATESAFRWEGLRQYRVDSDGGDFERYVAGEPTPTMERKQKWLNYLRERRDRGIRWHRVRLLRPPLSDYERYACEWGYAYNVPAGDDARILDLAERQLPSASIDHDFWLVDDRQPIRMHYTEEGEFLGASLPPEHELSRYQAARNALWAAAEPFFSWWNRHLEYHSSSRRVVT